MNDTISRAAALNSPVTMVSEGLDWIPAYHIKELPSVQPEVIRCKGCKHWLDIDDGRQKHRMCADIYGDWFCADAERRTDG